MRSPRQPGWGLVIVLMTAAALILYAKIRPREAAPLSRASPGPAEHALKPRSLFAPFGPARKASPQRVAAADIPREEMPREVLVGRVLAPDGSPVPGATVSLGPSIETSGPDGRFTIPRGSGRLRVSHPDFFPREADADGAAAMSLVVVPGARIVGRALDAAGRPVPQARIQFGTGELPPSVLSDADGKYESPLLPPAPVCVLVTHADFQPESRVVAPRAGAKPGGEKPDAGSGTRCDVSLSQGDKLVVRARSAAGEPVPDAEAWIQNEELRSPAVDVAAALEWRFLGRTDDLGRLDTRKAPGVRATVRLSLAGFRDETGTTNASGGEVTIVMRPAPALRGQAVDAASGLPVQIRGIRLEVEQGAGFTEAPARGVIFESLEPGKLIVGLPPQEGTYRLSVSSRGSSSDARELEGSSEPVRFDGSTAPPPFVVRLSERLELRGAVTGPDGPLDGIAIELLADAPPESLLGQMEDGPQRFVEVAGVRVPAPFRQSAVTRTTARGRFSFQGLSHGTYRLRVKPSARADEISAQRGAGEGLAEYLSAPFAVPWDGEFPVTLSRGAELSGALLAADGRTEPGATVILIRGDEWARVARTGADGKFLFESLSPGADYRLVIARSRERGPEGDEISRSLTIEEGKDIAYDVRRPGAAPGPTAAPPQLPAEDVVRDLATPVKAIAKEDDLNPSPAEASSPADDSADGLPAGSPSTPEPEEPAEAGSADEPGKPRMAAEPARTDAAGAQARLDLKLVSGDSGKPFAGAAEVELSELGGKKTWSGSSREGAFEARSLAPGIYTLRVKAGKLLVHEEDLRIERDTTRTVTIDEPHEVSVRLIVKDGEPLRGEASIVLSRDGKELYRSTEVIDGKVTVPTPGAGDYELVVESEDQVARMRVKVTREEE